MQPKNKSPQTVCVAMSGGVDSSVAAFLLQQEGFELIGIHLRFWHDPSTDASMPQKANKCCDAGALADARRIAHQLAIPFYVFDVSEDFYQQLVAPFFAAYQNNQTPNPCVRCNQFIKFGALWQKAESLGASYIATGHYAQIKKEEGGAYAIYRGRDDKKDQSYFLYRLSQEQLGRSLLPLGGYIKEEIFALAKQHELLPAHRKESQDLCFVQEDKIKPLLQRHLGEKAFKSGPIIDQASGKTLGSHQGLPSYTIGQRRGLQVGGQAEPLYVIDKNAKTNTLLVGQAAALKQTKISLTDLCFNLPQKPASGSKVDVRVRYRSTAQAATYYHDKNQDWLEFEQPQSALTPGQSAVFYQGTRLLGGGVMIAN